MLIPRAVILDFHDSYSHNIKHLFRQLLALPSASTSQVDWDDTHWEERVLVINVDSLTW